ncbi:sugar (pentulose or hexulose) kinase [Mycetocola sp. BIGb0189]|uniref:FGGY-family carbohydrate kinase n=1 Tax=Mycetocola sp. BIGb0189 TaxID=2940604 RepID=UPI0021687980|nr:FGGY-family carbohydrate kinase [Mycetocola sp. BIGb0189]MCS4275047.1 sugar (pentulose or hexulose) kinase [Mycetocola sp. BIGb0189]
MTSYFLGIDNGSQSAKVTIFDRTGAVHATGHRALRPNATPAPGRVEHPDDDLWEAISFACREAMENFTGDPAEIRGVGLCTIRFCRAMLRADGTLAQPVLSWMDERVSRAYEDTDPDVAYVTTSSGYISHRMTGVFADTAANYQGMWPIDTDTWEWSTDEAVIDACGIPRGKLFTLVMPGDTLGLVSAEASAATGIPAGLPVIATANDKAVEALGCGLRSPREVLVSLGTYIASMTLGHQNITDAEGFWTNFASEPHEYLYESDGIRRGMWTVSWYRDLLGEETAEFARASGRSVEEFLGDGAATVPPGADGLVAILDWLAPTDKTYRRGAFLGFDGRQGRFHLYRAILEAIALEMGQNAGRMADRVGTEFERVLVSGGGSSSDLMMQIFADVFGIPATRTRVNNGAGLGAAICVAVALGEYPDFDTAVAAMVQPGDTFEPDPERVGFYARLGAYHARLREFTDPMFEVGASIMGTTD